jgi:hypothetical protein
MEPGVQLGEHARVALENVDETETFTDVDRPDGERVRVRFRGDAARNPEVAAGLVQLLVEGADRNFYAAVTTYATGLGLGAAYYLGSDSVIIEINEPVTLKPLVNASGGSPRSRASRHPSIPPTRPLDRLRGLLAPAARSSARRRARRSG